MKINSLSVSPIDNVDNSDELSVLEDALPSFNPIKSEEESNESTIQTPLRPVEGFDVQFARGLNQPVAAVQSIIPESKTPSLGENQDFAIPSSSKTIIGTPQQVIEQTQPKELTKEEYQAKIYRMSNQAIAIRQKEYNDKMEAKAKMADSRGIMTGVMGRVQVASMHPYATKSMLDSVEKVLNVVHGDSKEPITAYEYATFKRAMSRVGDTGKKMNKTGATSDMDRTLFNVERNIEGALQKGLSVVESELSGPNAPKNITDYNTLVGKAFNLGDTSIASGIGKEQAMQMMPAGLRVAQNLDEANFPVFQEWWKGKTGGELISKEQLVSDPYIRNQYETKFKSERPYYSWEVGGDGKTLVQNIPTTSKLKYDEEGDQEITLRGEAASGIQPNFTIPKNIQIYKDAGAGEVPRYMLENKELDVSSMAGGKLTGKAVTNVSSSAIGSTVNDAIKRFDSGMSQKDAILNAMKEAESTGTISGLDSPDAKAKIINNIRSGMLMHYTEKQEKARAAIAAEHAAENAATDKSLVKYVDKQMKVSDIFGSETDRTALIRQSNIRSREDLYKLANNVIYNTLDLDTNSRQGIRIIGGLERSVDGDLSNLDKTDPALAMVVRTVRGQLENDLNKVENQNQAGVLKLKSDQTAQEYELSSRFGLNAPRRDFAEFDTNNKIVKMFNPNHEDSITIKNLNENPNIDKDIKDAVVSIAGTGGKIQGVPVVGVNKEKIDKASILASIASNTLSDLKSKGLYDDKVQNDFSLFKPAIKDKNGNITKISDPPRYVETMSQEAKSLWNQGQRHTNTTVGNQMMQAAYVMARSDAIKSASMDVLFARRKADSMIYALAKAARIPDQDLKSQRVDPSSTTMAGTVSYGIKSPQEIVQLIADRVNSKDDPYIPAYYDKAFIREANNASALVEDQIKKLEEMGILPQDISESVQVSKNAVNTYRGVSDLMSKYNVVATPYRFTSSGGSAAVANRIGSIVPESVPRRYNEFANEWLY
jgi:hypothetical protein